MPLSFPQNPQTGSTYTANGITWTWTGTVWQRNTLVSGLDLTSVTTSAVPSSNNQLDLGSTTNRWRDLYLADELVLGSATVTSSGSAIALPSGSTVGGSAIANTSGGTGGPKITAIAVTNSSWTTLDDTAVDTTGGYIKITGTSFSAGCLVYFNQTPANSVSFISSTELRVTTGALAAGTYVLYVINTDGGVAISVPGVTFSNLPAWQTASSLADQYDGVVITLGLVATDAASYALSSGSLPPGLSLAANTGVISGTVTGVSNDTTYTFTVTATDAQLQDSPRTFTVTITVSDPYFRLTTLLLGGEQGNTVVRDSSVNNFNLTVVGDARASNFTPYGTGWSVYFDGNGDYLSIANNAALTLGTSDFTIEMFLYWSGTNSGNAGNVTFIGTEWSGSSTAGKWIFYFVPSTGIIYFSIWNTNIITATTALVQNRWYHLALTRSGTSFRLFIDGLLNATGTSSLDANSGFPFYIGLYYDPAGGPTYGYFPGYLSNLRVLKGTALYTANFTPATTSLTAITNTSLLTCHTNRFLDGSTNNFAITRNGDAAVRSFNPFGITNTGDSGSMYFDGTGDYLRVADNDAWHFGSGNFTVEAWYYPTTTSAQQIIVAQSTAAGGGTGLGWQLMTSNDSNVYLRALVSADGSGWVFDLVSSSKLQISAWNHVAFVRNGTTFQLYLNGAAATSGSTTSSSTLYNTTTPLTIGASNAPNQYVTGYVSGVHIVKGTAIYTGSTYTVPTSSLTPVANTQLLTLQYRQPHNNHGFQDASSNQFLITRNGNASQGTFSPFSQTGWSNYFAASSTNALTFATGSGVAYGTGDFCQEFFLYANSYPSLWRIISYSAPCASMLQQSGAVLNLDTGVGTLNTGITLPTNTWFHLAYTRQSGRIRVFVDGVLRYNIADATSYSNASVDIGGAAGFSQSWDGYISNARIIKGSVPAAYQTSSTTNSTTIFTPPTSPLTAVTGTELLTCQSNRFADTNTQTTAKTITVTGSPSVQALSPFGPTAVYDPAVHGGSVYFDISGDYLSTPSTTQLDFGTGDFTIEFYFYAIAANYGAGEGVWPFFSAEGYFGAGGSVNWDLLYYDQNSTFGLNRRISDVGSGIGSNAVTLPKQSWNHLAVVRSSGTVRFYLNGTDIGGGSYTANINSTSVVNVNRRRGGNGTVIWYANMYMSSIRIVKGTAVYTSAFTPPTAPVTATTNTQLLLNFTDAAIVDRTGRMVLETVADAKTSSVQVKYGNGAMYFDGTGDRLYGISSQNYNFGTGDFTIELWVYPLTQGGHGSGNNDSIIDFRPGSNGVYGTLYIFSSGTSINWFVNSAIRITGGAISNNTWTHISVCRSNGNTRLFLNGTQSGSTYADTNNYLVAPIMVGEMNDGAGAGNFHGYMDDLRITRGYARYTANFTPPTAPHRLK